jgi:hypothetical protein
MYFKFQKSRFGETIGNATHRGASSNYHHSDASTLTASAPMIGEANARGPGSMSGKPISKPNQGLSAFRDELSSDALASKRVEISINTFGPVEVKHNFSTIDGFYPRTLVPTGATPWVKPSSEAWTY